MKKILMYLEKEKLSPRGGPLGVGYYYFKEMEKNENLKIDFIECDSKKEEFHAKGRNITKYLPNWFNKIHRNIRWTFNTKRFLEKEPVPRQIDFNSYDVVYFHETADMYKEKALLENYKGIVILQSHSPLPFGQEQCSGISRFSKLIIKDIEKKFEKIDIYAFERADYVVFPCKEAVEPYRDNWEYFRDYEKKNKDKFRFIKTGIYGVEAKKSKLDIRNELHIPKEDFVISYAGRHNLVKGYDLLIEIGKEMLKDDSNWVTVAGRPGFIKSPTIKNWIEIGWTLDPYSYIAASDVFVLPNRVTYFDLVLLEVLSLGQIVVASRTGGNKYFEGKLPGIFLYDTVEEAVNILNTIKNMPKNEIELLKNHNKEYFEKELTVSNMIKEYLKVVENL